MKKNLIQKIKCLLCGVLLLVPLLPFSVYADDYTSSTVVGFDVSYVDTVFDNVQNKPNYIYEVRITLDDSYVGYLNISGTVSYNDGAAQTLTLSSTNRFVNGNQIVFKFYIVGSRYATAQDRPSLSSTQLTYGNHNLTKHSDIQSLDQIIDILNDLYTNTDGIEGLMSNQLSQLQDIVLNTSNLASYLDTLTKLKQWDFPYESFNIVNYQFQVNRQYKGFTQYDFYTYPFYEITSGNTVFVQWCNTNQTYSLIMGTTFNIIASNSSNFLNISNRDGTSTASVNKVTELTYRTNGFKYVKIDFTVQTSADYYIKFVSNDNMFVPIYCGLTNNKYISTDFALKFGLSNQLLDDLHTIAQGTSASTSSSNNLEDSANDIVQNSSTMFNFENQQNQNMNNALQNINTNYDIGSFGSSFLSSANWVRTQFDNITSSTPFGSVLSFSLLLGLALLIIGKVYK